MKSRDTDESAKSSISLHSYNVEFQCEAEVPTECPKTIDVEIHLPFGNFCALGPDVKVMLDGKLTETPVKITLKGKVVASNE